MEGHEMELKQETNPSSLRKFIRYAVIGILIIGALVFLNYWNDRSEMLEKAEQAAHDTLYGMVREDIKGEVMESELTDWSYREVSSKKQEVSGGTRLKVRDVFLVYEAYGREIEIIVQMTKYKTDEDGTFWAGKVINSYEVERER
jgi:hypothetical protein